MTSISFANLRTTIEPLDISLGVLSLPQAASFLSFGFQPGDPRLANPHAVGAPIALGGPGGETELIKVVKNLHAAGVQCVVRHAGIEVDLTGRG